MAVVLGLISLGAMGYVVFQSYASAGDARVSDAFTVLLALVYSITGFGLGLVTVQNKGYYRLFPVLGLLLNLAALGGIRLILYAGAYL